MYNKNKKKHGVTTPALTLRKPPRATPREATSMGPARAPLCRNSQPGADAVERMNVYKYKKSW